MSDDPLTAGAPASDAITVTATVTPRSPWDLAGMDEDTWNGLNLPTFLARATSPMPTGSPSSPADTTPTPRATTTPPAGSAATTVDARAVFASSGEASGEATSSTTSGGATGGMFDQFRVDPDEIEQKIKTEADTLWRNWMPTKTDRKRPRLSTYVKRVRKQFYS